MAYEVGDNILKAVMKQESGGNINAVSKKGAKGLYQVMDDTARDPGFGIKPLKNYSATEQRRFAKDYLGAMLNRYNGDLNKALAAYNAGPGRVDKAGGVPNIPETQNYVKNILNTLNPIGSAEAAQGEDGPGDWVDVTDKYNAQPLQEDDPGDWVDVTDKYNAPQKGIGERALENLPRDIKNIGESTIQTIAHPIDTAESLAGVVRGGMQKALPESVTNYLVEKGITPEARQQFEQFIEPYKKDFGSLEGFGEAIAERPATTFLNVTGGLSGLKALAKGAKGGQIADLLRASKNEASIKNADMLQKADVLKRGQEAGFKVPKSEVAPSFINNRLEGIAGKAAMGQQAVLDNQYITTKLAKKALGIADDQPLSVETLKKFRADKAKPYEEVANLPMQPSLARGYSRNSVAQTTAADDLFNLRQARNDAQGWYEAAKRSASPDDMKKAKMAEREAAILEARIEQKAIAAGKPELVNELRKARTEIKKSYDIEKALNVATGQVDPAIIGRSLDKGTPLTGELKLIGEFREAFPKFMKEGEKAQIPGVSKVEALSSLILGTAGAAGAGPIGALAGTLPLLSTPIRDLLLSKPYQNKFVTMAKKNPSKTLKLLNRTINGELDKKALGAVLNQQQDNEK